MKRHKTARKYGHTGNPGEKKRRRRGEGVEMAVGVEEVNSGSCSCKLFRQNQKGQYKYSGIVSMPLLM